MRSCQFERGLLVVLPESFYCIQNPERSVRVVRRLELFVVFVSVVS